MPSLSFLTRALIGVVVASSSVLLIGASAASAADNTGFGFNARDVAGAATGSVTLTGGGAFDPTSGFVHAGGGFRCTTDVNQGPLTGCLAGEGVRWDAESLLPSTGFKCTSSASEAPKTATVAAFLKAIGLADKRTLLVLGEVDENLVKSCRNLPNLRATLAHQINPYDLLGCDQVLLTAGGLERVKEVFVR